MRKYLPNCLTKNPPFLIDYRDSRTKADFITDYAKNYNIDLGDCLIIDDKKKILIEATQKSLKDKIVAFLKVIKVKIDEASDEYLTVSMDGVKLSGVKARFNELQEELDKVEKGTGLNEDGTYGPDVFARFISGATSLKEADSILDEKLGVEIERAQSAETALQADIDEVVENVAELSAATEAFSAQTVSELDRLDRQDIKSDDYTFRVNGTEEEGNGLIINRKGGEGPIIIAFDGNFGSGMPLAL